MIKLSSFLRHLPYFPALSAMLAMAVSGLTVPGSPLQVSMSGSGFAITSGCLAVAGGIMMSIAIPFLGKGNATAVPAKTPSGPGAGASTPTIAAHMSTTAGDPQALSQKGPATTNEPSRPHQPPDTNPV